MTEGIQLSTVFYSLGKYAGIIGFTCLSLLIISGDTARLSDKFFGLDKIIKFQRKFSLITLIFIVFHPLFFILSSSAMAVYLIPDFSVIPLALGTISLYIFLIVMIASRFYKRISYTIWQYIHILTYILFFFSIYHAYNLGSDSDTIYMQILYSVLTLGVIIGIIYRTICKIKHHYAGKFYVKEIRQETNDTFSLVLSTPQNFSFKAGQFCFLRLNKNKLYGRHPFTISSSPNEKDLRFTIKNTGRFTKTGSELKIGEEIIVDGPFGIFINKDIKKDLVFIAGGVGITPFISMIQNQLENNKTQNITLIYCSRTEEDIIFRKELDAINATWFKKIYVLSQAKNPSSEEYIHGRITQDILEKYINTPSNSLFYICGPTGLKNTVKKILKELKVDKKYIFIEDFFW